MGFPLHHCKDKKGSLQPGCKLMRMRKKQTGTGRIDDLGRLDSRIWAADLQLLCHFQDLLAESDGVALTDKDYTIERVGNNKHRQLRFVFQFHLCSNLVFDLTVLVDSEDGILGQLAKFDLIELLCRCLILEEQHEGTAPFVEFISQLGDVVQGMVGWLLTHTEYAYNEVTTARL